MCLVFEGWRMEAMGVLERMIPRRRGWTRLRRVLEDVMGSCPCEEGVCESIAWVWA